jgi:hypothetical protein
MTTPLDWEALAARGLPRPEGLRWQPPFRVSDHSTFEGYWAFDPPLGDDEADHDAPWYEQCPESYARRLWRDAAVQFLWNQPPGSAPFASVTTVNGTPARWSVVSRADTYASLDEALYHHCLHVLAAQEQAKAEPRV